jgi:hypothetical protein
MRKEWVKWCILLGVMVIAASAALSLQAFDPTSNQVILYEHANFQGNSLRLQVGDNISCLTSKKMGTSSNWNDKISSIKVGANVRLITFQDCPYKGQCMGFLGSNAGGHTGGLYPKLSDWNYNDKISSLKVYSKDDTNASCP